MDFDYFGNERFRVLVCMANRQISIGEKSVIKLSQQEVAKILKISKVKVNSIISELKADGYLVQAGPRGIYELTEKASIVLQQTCWLKESKSEGGNENAD